MTNNKGIFRHNEQASQRAHGGEIVSSNLAHVFMVARQINQAIAHTIDDLNNYTEDNTVDPKIAIDEASIYLEFINQHHHNENRNFILKFARDQFTRWSNKHRKLDYLRIELDSLSRNISYEQNRIYQAADLAAYIKTTTDDAFAQFNTNQESYEKLLSNEAFVAALENDTRNDLNNNVISQMNVLIEQYHDSSQRVRQSINDVNTIVDLVRGANARCSVELDEIRDTLLPSVTQYQAELSSRAKVYADLIKNTKVGAEVALRASSSHRSIVEAIENANQSAQLAIEAVSKNNDELFNEVKSDGINDRSMLTVKISKDIEDAAEDEFQKLEGKC